MLVGNKIRVCKEFEINWVCLLWVIKIQHEAVPLCSGGDCLALLRSVSAAVFRCVFKRDTIYESQEVLQKGLDCIRVEFQRGKMSL